MGPQADNDGRYADRQSGLFLRAVATGQHLATVVLADSSTTITLREVLITSYSTGDGLTSDERNPNTVTPRTENVTFNFATFTYSSNGVTMCFDVATNSSC